ncbi:hypothetical protein [Nostocoides sp. HKS02]|uniref:hypothetical protein n=1 Tax=Nostocoides sp. HKS02 TaxID=1813880 RepID=UPI0012B487CD|nr:hypothetical protein [Tetrasphaera sp. HKS02]QGN59081.1 hypothetical protein GKE56_15650 [Tetrasphaera sp. HKS02]
MQPSSLVFLVIIAVWAAYFVQHWVARREHLATARSVDQFSESMRVLERRSPLPAADLSTPQPRSYAVSPARPARPQILVKRASAEPSAGSSAGPSAEPVGARVGPSAQSSLDPRAVRAAARRTRAMIMLGALSTVLVAVPLVALALLPLVTLVVPVASIALALGWARTTAVAERRARREVAPGRPAVRETALVDQPAAVVEPTAAEELAPVEGAEVDEPDPNAGELYDVQAIEAAERPVVAPARATPIARHLVDDDDIPLTWDPVPVPRPTYTMKSRATRPAPTAADLVGDADTEYAAYDQEPVRRVAGA